MPLNGPSAPEPVPAEAPTGFAELDIQIGPAQPWGTARGKVPPGQAHHLITTFGVLGSVIAGIAGAVLTLHISAGLTAPVFAELAVAIASAVLIASRRIPARRAVRRREASGAPGAFPETGDIITS
jgi:hypothetical protein